MTANVRASLLLILSASFLSGLALRAVDLGQVPWALSRAAGLAAFVVISLSLVMGLLISTRAADGVLKRTFVFEMHQFLSVVSLVLIAVHAGSLLFDGFLHFGSLSLVVPFLAPYRPFAVGLGVIAGWLAAITTASFWMRTRIGQKRWRTLHYATFLVYGGSLWHGVAAGTDTQAPAVYWMYIGSAALVSALVVLRIVGYKPAPKRRPATIQRTGSAA